MINPPEIHYFPLRPAVIFILLDSNRNLMERTTSTWLCLNFEARSATIGTLVELLLRGAIGDQLGIQKSGLIIG